MILESFKGRVYTTTGDARRLMLELDAALPDRARALASYAEHLRESGDRSPLVTTDRTDPDVQWPPAGVSPELGIVQTRVDLAASRLGARPHFFRVEAPLIQRVLQDSIAKAEARLTELENTGPTGLFIGQSVSRRVVQLRQLSTSLEDVVPAPVAPLRVGSGVTTPEMRILRSHVLDRALGSGTTISYDHQL